MKNNLFPTIRLLVSGAAAAVLLGLGGGAHAQAYVNATVGGRTGSRCVWPHQHRQRAATTAALRGARHHPAPCGGGAPCAHLHVRAARPCQELEQALRTLQRLQPAGVFCAGAASTPRQPAPRAPWPGRPPLGP